MNRMKCFLFLSLFVAIVGNSPAFAIDFDIWETGMSRQEIFSLAQRYDLPLSTSSVNFPNQRYNPKLLVRDAISYYYHTTLLDHHARIALHLSPAKAGYGQFLYEIEILFTDHRKTKDFDAYVLNMLQKKYGRPSRGTNIVQNYYVWKTDPESEVRLITGGGSTLQKKYSDLKIQAFARELSKSTFELSKEPAHHQDAGKF
jgi:hypothetical protein